MVMGRIGHGSKFLFAEMTRNMENSVLFSYFIKTI